MSPAAPSPERAGASALFECLDQAHQHMRAELLHMNRAVDSLMQGQLQPAGREQLQHAVHWFDTTAREHHLDEEKHVFPALQASGDPQAVEAASRLRQDHGWIEQNWLEIGPLLSAVVNGNHWPEPEPLQESVQLFTRLCLEHLALEESLAYPLARERLDAAALAAAGREMTERRKPRAARQPPRRKPAKP
ncbi:MAG: hemerythrin domain-containing protein [Desulfovibrionaceae bacterium]|nr:hemerythrin domain-containing protein [Desulfovibrionaceae bacterium]